jgi:hypothetical protein
MFDDEMTDGQLAIVPPAEPEQSATDKVPAAPNACPCG